MTPDQFSAAAWNALTAAREAREDQLAAIHAKLCGDAGELAANEGERIARPPVAESLLDNPVLRWAD